MKDLTILSLISLAVIAFGLILCLQAGNNAHTKQDYLPKQPVYNQTTHRITMEKPPQLDTPANNIVGLQNGSFLQIEDLIKYNPSPGVYTTMGYVRATIPCPPAPPGLNLTCEQHILIEESPYLGPPEMRQKIMYLRVNDSSQFQRAAGYDFTIQLDDSGTKTAKLIDYWLTEPATETNSR